MAEDSPARQPISTAPLEEPPPSEVLLPNGGLGAIFSEGSAALAHATAKVVTLEALLTLLTQDLSFDEFMREVLLALLRAVKSEAGSIFELDSKQGFLFFRAATGRSSDTITGFHIPVGQGIAGHVAESRQPLIISDLKGSRLHLKTIVDAVGFDARNLIAIPIVIRGRVYGVLEHLNRIGESTFSEADLELLSHLVSCAAKIIEVRLMLAWRSRAVASAREDKAA